ncbi:10772_t:CDS:2 [Paraglomus occultum]|uniref:10772_t:CDS:1 n=1 Tax=Paraglomus occultum TaxID=144539 RepID=A0A9N8WER6_9GLOM|nr:10772_t:CDS:2 [Paraglomus occultum]
MILQFRAYIQHCIGVDTKQAVFLYEESWPLSLTSLDMVSSPPSSKPASQSLQVPTNDEEKETVSLDEELIDHETFDQLLDMDDDENFAFSKGIVSEYFKQAEQTFKQMDDYFKEENLDELSKLGHFLKGSSAAIGLTKVKGICEKIQYCGILKDENGESSITEDEAKDHMASYLKNVKKEYREAEKYLKVFYEKRGSAISDDNTSSDE